MRREEEEEDNTRKGSERIIGESEYKLCKERRKEMMEKRFLTM